MLLLVHWLPTCYEGLWDSWGSWGPRGSDVGIFLGHMARWATVCRSTLLLLLLLSRESVRNMLTMLTIKCNFCSISALRNHHSGCTSQTVRWQRFKTARFKIAHFIQISCGVSLSKLSYRRPQNALIEKKMSDESSNKILWNIFVQFLRSLESLWGGRIRKKYYSRVQANPLGKRGVFLREI